MHEIKLHNVIYSISRFEIKSKILLKTEYFDFNAVRSTSLGSDGYVRTQKIRKFII